MKIGVISDTHIPLVCERLPEKIKEHFKGVDMILHAGDMIDMSVIDALREIAPNVEAVRGNMDSLKIQQTLPEKKIISAGKYKIGLIHGWGAPQDIMERLEREFKDVDIIVFGHTHSPINIRQNNVLFFNPGSPTDTVHAKELTIGILELNGKPKGRIIKL